MNHLPESRNYNRMLVIKSERSYIYSHDTVLFVGDYDGKSLAEKRQKVLRDYGKKLFKTRTANWFAEEGEEYGTILVDGAYRTAFNDNVKVGETIIYHDYRNETLNDFVNNLGENKRDHDSFITRGELIARLVNIIANERKLK